MGQDLVYKGFIEYVDTEEEETTMIAMELRDLRSAAEDHRGSSPTCAPFPVPPLHAPPRLVSLSLHCWQAQVWSLLVPGSVRARRAALPARAWRPKPTLP